jgi:hypothetical protein
MASSASGPSSHQVSGRNKSRDAMRQDDILGSAPVTWGNRTRYDSLAGWLKRRAYLQLNSP